MKGVCGGERGVGGRDRGVGGARVGGGEMVEDGERVVDRNVVGREKGVGGGDRGGRERDVGVEKNVVVIGEGDVAVQRGEQRVFIQVLVSGDEELETGMQLGMVSGCLVIDS